MTIAWDALYHNYPTTDTLREGVAWMDERMGTILGTVDMIMDTVSGKDDARDASHFHL
jgi:hypothetical protein